MRIVSWNIGHQTRELALKPRFEDALGLLAPDLLVLNEYVHGPSRESFVTSLGLVGLTHLLVSDRIGKNNQVLIASRTPMHQGNLRGITTSEGGGESNFLHVVIPGFSLEVVGIRVPAYERRSALEDFWRSLIALMAGTEDRRIVFVGDFNADPDGTLHVGSKQFKSLRDRGWNIPSPNGAHSFKSGTRIDHVAATGLVPPLNASYVTDIGGIPLCGVATVAISDHAPIVVDFDIS